ncbi:Glycoside hydrolase clan GH-D [Lasiodiplodia theobromae]|uniref:Glycoside hydrolase clan GH-D n=1 Tax=Lasiodiplodia theobromae TaxID=45133 RepID=UPI0015C2C495|nr:Glycoside hydrolase clan GH-D [Lasiodiplodia theobromae]KAF4540936.1 Glycoside hydrolase clan GH-D [Lasiodiplodia theobromae]KAF9634579.1 Glycoside hydrolase clan GH-D [Lasiodiplodia theobromae]
MEKLKQMMHHHRKRSSHAPSFALNAFRHWATAFVVCDFNVDVGPEILMVYPTDTPFSQADLTAICFNRQVAELQSPVDLLVTFPEQQTPEMGEDLSFQFSIRNRSPDVLLSSPCAPHGSPSTFYGSCLFRQEFDGTTKRSYNQKSLVLISNHNFPAFYMKLLQQMTSSGILCDPNTFEAACTQISAWPPPSIGRHELPFLGSLLVLEIAPHLAFPLQGLASPQSGRSDGVSGPIYAYQPTASWSRIIPYFSSLSDLYTVFEKMLLCENVVVMAKSPQTCSEVVSALVDLIRPIPYAGEIKPYLTMQSEFCVAGFNGGTSRHFIVGITNPFLLKRILSAAETSGSTIPYVLYLHSTGAPVPVKPSSSHPTCPPGFDIPGGIEANNPAKKLLKPDRSFLQQLDTMQRGGRPATDAIGPLVRRHFAELTAQFLAPILRYLATGMAPTVASPGGNPAYANFSEPDFLNSLSKYGTSIKLRGQGPLQRHRTRDALYGEFCRSPNFYSHLEMKLSLEKEASVGLLNVSR